MYSSTVLALLSAIFLSAPAASMPVNHAARQSGNVTTTFTGEGTWFDVGLGACGFNNVNTDLIVALPTSQYGTGQYCNQYVTITNTQTSKTAFARVRDKCPGCQTGHLDMSPGLFEALGAQLSQGVIPISWGFEPARFQP
ncbi:RlpA-like double-psi beta-barrel-containing domain containing protein [Tylopilus felleus]